MERAIDKLRESPHWSYSALNTYLNICQLKFYFQYIERAEPERQAACFPFGRAYHAVLTEQARLAITGRSLSTNEADTMFDDFFSVEVKALGKLLVCKPDESITALRDKGHLMLQTALLYWQDFYNIRSVAEAFTITVPGLSKPLIGEFDLVVDDGRDCCIVDWKTSARKWSEGKAHTELQASVFSYAYFRQHGNEPVFRFDVLTKTKTPEFTSHYTQRDADDFGRVEYLANLVEQGVAKGVFIPNETCFSCADCAYKTKCKVIHRKGI